ncbi:MAG: N(4)-(beta-N-acetylglucosaminyl)-L-asparaginase [Chthonomonadaceae bacterium]|nr:N(4)-(beta-N-acetylglucosaminyl)-L-asparaginase [Chthonomonadaceae bacterium]
MDTSLSRRDFVAASAALATAPFGAPVVWSRSSVKPAVISSSNGHMFKNGGDVTCVEKAYGLIESGGDVLEALIEGVNIVELDPADTSVGYGGVPNMDGVVQLDSSCMHGDKKWAGAVAALEGVRTPSKVAYRVASDTDHHLLVGEGAQSFARNLGFKIEDDLNTERSRKIWLDWKRRIDPAHFLDPSTRKKALMAMIEEGVLDPIHAFGTINCNGIDAEGRIAGVTTTSGLAFKISGRVGDSPILGAGLYVDGSVGAAGSTGRGEANLATCASFVIVEEMRRGAHPTDACLAAMRRIKSNTVEKRLLDDRGRPNFGMEYYAIDAKGRSGGASTNPQGRFALCDSDGPRLVDCAYAWG